MEMKDIHESVRKEENVHYTLQQLSEVQMVLPTRASWKRISIEHHRQPVGECDLQASWHALCITLQEGILERRINGDPMHKYLVTNGEFRFYPANWQQWVRWQEHTNYLLIFLEPDLFEQVADTSLPPNAFEVFDKVPDIYDPLISQIGLALDTETGTENPQFSTMYVESLANTLVAHLLRRYISWKPGNLVTTEQISSPVMQRITEYIRSKADQTITLNELAALASMSSYHFLRVFKRSTGLTPHQYILSMRIERAKTLLLQRDFSIAEIASTLGFFDQSHFTNAFKRLVGVTPQRYLETLRKNLQ